MLDVSKNKEPFPTCTNIRYDNTNGSLLVDIDDLFNTKCSGYISIFSNGVRIHEERFEDFRKIPRCYSLPYKPKSSINEEIEVKFALGNKIVKSKAILNENNIRNGLSWEEWEKGI